MIVPEFASCLLKLSRAEHHLDTFKTEFAKWSGEDPYRIVKKSNDDGSRYTVSLEVKKPPYVDRWALIGGDCIHNLRSALDTMVYALAIRDSGQDPPPDFKNLMFPVVTTASEFPKKLGLISPLNGISRAFIERSQPYNRSQKPIPMPMYVLSELDNMDKHRLLNVALQSLGDMKFAYTTILRSVPQYHTLRTAIRGDTDIAFIALDPPQRDVDFKVEASFIIIANYPLVGTGNGVTSLYQLLEVLVDEVRSVINGVP